MVRMLLLALALLFAFTPAVFSDEEAVSEKSEAARLFREAWWLETGVGALDRARAKYEEAVAAEGGVGVRARSLYRQAIVLHRMGRVQAAVGVLETLTKTFPGEAKYHDLARARLDEWSGEDLKGAFTDWYRRFQYSPEFQAKIVDLVLQLGAVDQAARNTASSELATIGAPALPALRAHATSVNYQIASQATDLMFQLGELPPTAALARGPTWMNFWGRVMATEGDERARIVSDLDGVDTPWARMIRSGLDGRGALVDVLLGFAKDGWSGLGGYKVPAVIAWAFKGKLSADVLTRTYALIADPAVHAEVRTQIARQLKPQFGQLDRETLLAWAKDESEGIRRLAWDRINRDAFRGPDNWKVIASAMRAIDTDTGSELQAMTGALLRSLRDAPEDLDTAVLVETLNHCIGWKNCRWALELFAKQEARDRDPVARRLILEFLSQARGDGTGTALKSWLLMVGEDEAAYAQLLAWARDGKHMELRQNAMRQAAAIGMGPAARLLEPLTAAEGRLVELRHPLFEALRSRNLLDYQWTADDIGVLADAVAGMRQPTRGGGTPSSTVSTRIGGVTYTGYSFYGTTIGTVFLSLIARSDSRALFFDAAAADPVGFPDGLMRIVPEDFTRLPDGERVGAHLLRTNWDHWNPAQREAALPMFLQSRFFPKSPDDGQPATLLRELLRRRAGATPESDALLLKRIGQPTMTDLEVVYDFDSVNAVIDAARWLRGLPADRETYDAFLCVFDPNVSSDEPWAQRIFFEKFRGWLEAHPEVQAGFIERALAQGNESAGQGAVGQLNQRNSVKDMPLWLTALAHPDASVRILAAKGMGRIYDLSGIRALTAAIDDPNPSVRDAALQSLERIREIEEQKAYWKQFAGDLGK